MADDDWDLHAVVRGCTATSSYSTTTSCGGGSSRDGRRDHLSISASACFEDLLLLEPKKETTSKQDDLHNLYKPFFFPAGRPSEMTILPSQNLPISPLSVLDKKQQQPFSVVNLPKPTTGNSQKSSSRPKKRKNCMKRVRHVAAEEVSGDVWSWRKYGQKPIKGSPYPRGYYRCSTSKGCMARKQVERNRSDPGMFILTYTGEHNHPIPNHRTSVSSSAASSHKPPDDIKASLETKLDNCRVEPDNDQEANDDENFSPLDDDFFEGLEGFTAGNCSMDEFAVELPWLSDGGTPTEGRGGGGGG